MTMDKQSATRLIRALTEYSKRYQLFDDFDENDFVSTFEQLSPHVTLVDIEFNNFEMIRSRATQPSLDFEHLNQMIYPPANKVKLGRCNFDGQSILYASSNVETSFLEIGFSEPKSCAVLAQFRLKHDTTLTLRPIGELDHYRRHRRPRLTTAGVTEKIEQLLTPLGHYDQIVRWYVDAYLADFFGRQLNEGNDRHLYEITSRIANALLKDDHIDGLIFPSVKHTGGFNYAIKPSVFDARFEISKYALTAPVHEHGYGLFEYFVHAEGNQLDQNGNFQFHTNPHFNARSTWPLSADQ